MCGYLKQNEACSASRQKQLVIPKIRPVEPPETRPCQGTRARGPAASFSAHASPTGCPRESGGIHP